MTQTIQERVAEIQRTANTHDAMNGTRWMVSQRANLSRIGAKSKCQQALETLLEQVRQPHEPG